MRFATSSCLLFFPPPCGRRITTHFWTDRVLSFIRRWDLELSLAHFAMPTTSYQLKTVGSYSSEMRPQAFTDQKEDGMMRHSLWPNLALQRTRRVAVVCNLRVPWAGSLSLGRSAISIPASVEPNHSGMRRMVDPLAFLRLCVDSVERAGA